MDDIEFQEKIIELLKNVNGKLNELLNNFYAPYGLTVVQAMVLLELHRNGEQNITDLSNNVCMVKGNLSQLCKRLEKNGLIERVRDSEDERYVNIKMTKHSENIVKELEEKISNNKIPILLQIENQKKSSIIEALNILNDCLSSEYEKNHIL